MDTNQELLAIYHLLRHQEERLYELHNTLRSILKSLESEKFLADYRTHLQEIGSSAKALGYAETLQLIDASIQRLKELPDRPSGTSSDR
jgi:hypothetical protein